MILLEKINVLSKLGDIMRHIGAGDEWPGFQIGINKEEYEDLAMLVTRVHIYNGWFTPKAVQDAFNGIAKWLTEENLTNWFKDYAFKAGNPKTIAIIMAGNIPLVGFHDFLSVFLSGHKAMVKLSSDDQQLFPALIKTMALFNPEVNDAVEIKTGRLGSFDAVIATGSDNSASYFQTYFGKYPHIIRKNRSSMAVINGSETPEELVELGKDIFTYFGLGCRNVSQVWVPKDFDLNRLFEAFFGYNEIINHNKYANNYDYNKALFLMNMEELLDNGFILLKEDEQLVSPLAMLHYKRYDEKKEVEEFIEQNNEKIQAIVGQEYIPFGKAQNPGLDDYADGVNTLTFLQDL